MINQKFEIKLTEKGTYAVFINGYAEPLRNKEFETFSKAEEFKESYVVEQGIKIDDIDNELFKNIDIKIPKTICMAKFPTIEIEEQTLTLFAAKPGNGKTLFLVDFMRECLSQKMKCIFFSLEMTKEGIMKRYRSNDTIKKSDFLILKDREDLTIESLETTIKYYCEHSSFGYPDIVFVDYIQYFSTENESIKEFALHLKRLAKKYHIRFICAAQLNADFSIKKPNDVVDSMSGSREISKTSENIIVTYKKDNIFHLEVAKCRNGKNGSETHMCFILNPSTGILERYIDEDDFMAANNNLNRREIIAHEIGHNFLQFIITKKISPIRLTDWGGYILDAGVKDANNQLKILFAGVIAETILGECSSPHGHGSDMEKIDRVLKGIYLIKNCFIPYDLEDEKQRTKYDNFCEKYNTPIIQEVTNLLKDNEINLRKILDILDNDDDKKTFSTEELNSLFTSKKWITKNIK